MTCLLEAPVGADTALLVAIFCGYLVIGIALAWADPHCPCCARTRERRGP